MPTVLTLVVQSETMATVNTEKPSTEPFCERVLRAIREFRERKHYGSVRIEFINGKPTRIVEEKSTALTE